MSAPTPGAETRPLPDLADRLENLMHRLGYFYHDDEADLVLHREDIDLLAEAADALREREEVPGWRPIDTAPVRTWVLTVAKNGAGRWTVPQTTRLERIDGEWQSPVHDSNVIVYHQPTHWMPLPAPPARTLSPDGAP